MTDDLFDWIPLKEYAVDRGKSQRTIRRWIKLGYIEARRDGEAPYSPWLIKTFRAAKSA